MHNQIKGFSLIELSIVLIIIGLVISGVTAGSSLIETAKLRGLVAEIRSISTDIYAFKVAKNRYPGDYDNAGWTGICHGTGCPDYGNEKFATYNLTQNSGNSSILKTKKRPYNGFGGEYNGLYVGPKAGPWVELYLEGVTNFKPTLNPRILESNDTWKSDKNDNLGSANNIYPCSRSISGLCMYVFATFREYKNTNVNYYLNNIKPETVWISLINSFIKDNNGSCYVNDPLRFKRLDEKLDDGIHNLGNVRADCGQKYYDDAISVNKKCCDFYFKLP